MSNKTQEVFNNSVSSVLSLIKSDEGHNNNNSSKCGFCGYYPAWLQRLATAKAFLIGFCVKNVLQGMIFTYFVGIETSIERHFQFDGRSIGLLLTLGEIGPILTAIVISHYGSQGNKPRWMGFGLFLIAIALLLGYSMHLIFPAAELPDYHTAGDSGENHTFFGKSLCVKLDNNLHVDFKEPNLNLTSSKQDCTIDVVKRRWAFAAWVIVYSILNIGATTVYTLGAPYLDDSIPKQESPFYFGITIAVRIIGPLFGFFLSSACLKLYVNLSETPSFSANDPRWIGAWWIGLLVMAFLIAMFAIVMGSFPRQMKKDEKPIEMSSPPETNGSSASVSAKASNKMTDLKQALRRLVRNSILMCSCGSAIFTILGLAGFFIWLPKYFEHEFRLSKSKAAMYSGISGNVTMIVGVLLSGYLMKRYTPTGRQVAALVAIAKYIYAFGILGLMLVTCSFNSDLPGQLNEDGSLTLEQHCNYGCQCTTEEFIPICIRDESKDFQQTYFSPCHAGCTSYPSTNNSVGSSCSCSSNGATITPGFCTTTCFNLYTYMIVLAILKFIVSTSTIGNFIIDLRCVEPNDKALALGVIAAAAGLLGFLPNPIIYGSMIDSSCLVWETSCGKTGSCWFYDTDKFRFKLHGLTGGLLMVSGIFEIITYIKAKNLDLFVRDEK